MRYILNDSQPHTASVIGGKAAALAQLTASDLAVPRWFVLRPEACLASLTDGQLPDSLHPEVAAELHNALQQLAPKGQPVAVRSSALDEDGLQHSFAGQLESFLNVAHHEVPEKVLAVWQSGFSERVMAYRQEHGLTDRPQPPAVLIQRMVHAEASGVAFSADPVSGRQDVAVVSAVYGFGTGLVSGEAEADTFLVDASGQITRQQIARKISADRVSPGGDGGLANQPVPTELIEQPAITDSQVQQVAHLAQRASQLFGCPQDIEWTLAQGQLYLLQSRPITTLVNLPEPSGTMRLWDNSNIAESYNGVTTPLTFSFAREVYQHVYLQFCKILRVPESMLQQNQGVFRGMLGLIQGRIYYNLLNWYRVLALLPGFRFNRQFMEQMMGVREGLPGEVVAELGQSGWGSKIQDALRMAGSTFALIWQHWRLGANIKRFFRRLDDALVIPGAQLKTSSADQLASHYRNLQRRLLTRWDAPLVNDFFAMIFFGTLKQLTTNWCGDCQGTLHNDLLCGVGQMVSAEPARLVRQLAQMASRDPQLTNALCEGSPAEINRQVAEDTPLAAEFRQVYYDYLQRFGDRCLEELKLESPTLHDDPLPFFRSVGHLARQDLANSSLPQAAHSIREAAEQQVRQALQGQPLRRWIFHWVLQNTRRRVRDRENLRLERTRLFGRVRRLFVELGRRLSAGGQLDDPQDVFYLETEEVLGFLDGTATTLDLRGLVAVRRVEFARYRQAEPPPDRFSTAGPVPWGRGPVIGQTDSGFSQTEQQDPQGEDLRRGQGCCPGVVRGPVRVVTDPRDVQLEAGEILVAQRTDPGWIMLLPSASGLVVERGSLLSHSAIVSRELGLPAVVSLPGATRWLADGERIELDGSTGVVRKLSGLASGSAVPNQGRVVGANAS